MTPQPAYAFVCSSCEHPAAWHRVPWPAPTPTATYRCSVGRCGCQIDAHAAVYGIDRREYRRRFGSTR